MQRRIPRAELRPGMFVVSHGLGTFDSPLQQVGRMVYSLAAAGQHLPPEAQWLDIDTERSAEFEESTLGEELPIAKRLYAEALNHVKSFVADVRRGTDIDYRQATPLVQSFIESVFRNEAAAVTLFKLRGFDEYTYTHSINVSLLAVLLGKHLGLDRDTLLKLGLAGMYHDVGKARIPESILNKPGKLTESEFAAMKAHPLEGYRIMRGQPDLDPEILRAVVEHHERHDGSGYPRGIKGDEIGRFSRVIAVVDVYDALTSKRVYKDAMAPAKALGMMYQWRDKDFTPQAIEGFIRCIGVFPVGSFVRLTGGEYGIVASINAARPTKPEVKVILDAKLRPQMPRVLDLWAAEGSPGAQDIAEVLNPADYKLDLERFISG